MIQKNLKLSKYKKSFDDTKHIYQNDLNKSNFNYKLEYNLKIDKIKQNTEKENVYSINNLF